MEPEEYDLQELNRGSRPIPRAKWAIAASILAVTVGMLGAQEINDGVVHMTMRFPDDSTKTGLGFVFGVEGSTLHIVAPTSLLISDYGDVFFGAEAALSDGSGTEIAEIVGGDSDIAILSAVRPDGYTFPPHLNVQRAGVGARVRVGATRSAWDDNGAHHFGTVIESDGSTFTVEARRSEAGMVGAPIQQGGGLAGIIINDQRNTITAVHGWWIVYLAYTALGIFEEDRWVETPYLVLSPEIGIEVPFLSYRTAISGVSVGLHAHIGIADSFAVGVAALRSLVWTLEHDLIDRTHRFRNRSWAARVSARFRVAGASDEEMSEWFAIGYEVAAHAPEVNVDSAGWRPLRDYSQFAFEYSNVLHAFTLGFGAQQPISSRAVLSAFGGLRLTLEPYYLVNVLEPFDEDISVDFSIFVNGHLGFLFGNRVLPPTNHLTY